MPIERISTRSVHQRTLVDFNRVQSHLLELQKQISSGIKTDDFKGLAGQVEQFTNLDGKIRKAVTYQESNEIVITRIQTANVAFDGMVETVNDIKNLLVQWRNPGLRPTLPFTQQMEAFKKTLTGQLNQTADGRFLFGGSRTDIPPVIDPLRSARPTTRIIRAARKTSSCALRTTRKSAITYAPTTKRSKMCSPAWPWRRKPMRSMTTNA